MSTPSQQAFRELAPTGKLRAAINHSNVVLAHCDARTGALTGITVDLARELGKRLGVEVELVPFDAAGKVSACTHDNVWDIGFLAIDPVRAAEIAFTPPYVVIESSFMVRDELPMTRNEDVDAAGVRVAVAKGAAYDLYLSRALKHASLERAPTPPDAFELFRSQGFEAMAGVKQFLAAHAANHPGLRVLDTPITAVEQAMCMPKGRDAAHAYLVDFIEEMKASGFVADAMKRHGKADAALVAPPAAR